VVPHDPAPSTATRIPGYLLQKVHLDPIKSSIF
jgi:hypothetical protein